MNQYIRKITALLLAGTLTLGVGMVPGYADEASETAQAVETTENQEACAGAAFLTDAIGRGEFVSLENHFSEVGGIGVGLKQYYNDVAAKKVSKKKKLKMLILMWKMTKKKTQKLNWNLEMSFVFWTILLAQL